MIDRKLTKREQAKVAKRLQDELYELEKKHGSLLLKTKRIKLSNFLFNIEEKDIYDVIEFCVEYDFDSIRFCEKCGKPIIEGYCDEGDAYCSLECLGMTYEELNKQYSDEHDCVYWTEWEL